MIWFGLLSVLLAAVSYSFYLKDIFAGRTKPHAVTWLVWAFLNGFIFLQQMTNEGGAGAWVTGAAAIVSLCIFILSFKHGERHITRLDWLCLAIVGLIIVLWTQRVSEEVTVVLACVVFLLGFIPTFRKAYKKPHQETLATFGLNSAKFLISLLALQSLTIVTGLYPLFLGVLNGCFAIYLVFRRYKMHTRKTRRA